MNRRSLLAFGCAAVTAPLSGLFARSKKVLPDGQEILGAAIKAGVEFRIESFRRSGARRVIANLSSEEEKALNEILSQRNGGAITVAELRELAK